MRVALVSLMLATAAHGGEISFVSLAMRMRQDQLLRISRPVMSPAPRPTPRLAFSLFGGSRYPWKLSITATCFWAGESAESGGGVSNYKSAWDSSWSSHAPYQNRFYVALPYNDVEGAHTKAEAVRIPWYGAAFVRDGQSIIKDRWVIVRHGGKICYCQVEDCGPFRTDSFNYCFGPDRPSPNRNQNAGIDLSLAARDYLGMSGMDTVDWRWCDEREVPRSGPWTMRADNNRVALLQGQNDTEGQLSF
jgi:hypothetical protein